VTSGLTRIRAIDPDVARLRRDLVDHGLVVRTRSGSEYALVQPVDKSCDGCSPDSVGVWPFVVLR